jgi:hypothetical protein
MLTQTQSAKSPLSFHFSFEWQLSGDSGETDGWPFMADSGNSANWRFTQRVHGSVWLYLEGWERYRRTAW